MAYNSNNWETEAKLRNERKAKADSMSALLDHVDWNPDTLEISLSGITLKWGDIEGADNVATKEYVNGATSNTVRYTQIGSDYVITQTLEATNLELYGNCKMTGGSIDINSNSGSFDTIKLSYDNGSDLRTATMNPQNISVASRNRTTDALLSNVSIHNDWLKVFDVSSGKTTTITANSITVGGVSVATTSDLSGYVPKPTSEASKDFFRPIGFTNNSNTSVGYMKLSVMQKWLGMDT